MLFRSPLSGSSLSTDITYRKRKGLNNNRFEATNDRKRARVELDFSCEWEECGVEFDELVAFR